MSYSTLFINLPFLCSYKQTFSYILFTLPATVNFLLNCEWQLVIHYSFILQEDLNPSLNFLTSPYPSFCFGGESEDFRLQQCAWCNHFLLLFPSFQPHFPASADKQIFSCLCCYLTAVLFRMVWITSGSCYAHSLCWL